MVDMETQISENTTNIKWLKENLNEVKSQMRTQTGILFTILLTLVSGLITMIKII